MNKKLLKLYAGLQALFVSGATLASLSACSDKTNEIANNDVIAEVMEITDPQETTTANYDAFDTTTAKTETTKVKTTTTKVYTVDVMDETTTKKVDESVSTETTTVKNDKGTKNSTSRSNTNNDNTNNDNTNNDNTYYDNTYNDVIENNEENSYSGRGNSGSSYSNGNSGTSRGNSGTSRGNSGSSNQTPQTQPPVVETQPPVTEAPVTQPPVTEPPVTEPPVIETQPPVQSYSINDIAYDWNAFDTFKSDLATSIMYIPGYMSSCINMPYGVTNGYVESSFILAALNSGYVNDNVLFDSFSYYSQNNLYNCKDFMYSFNMVQNTMGNDVDYSRFTINPSDGDFLNRADQAYREGWFDSFIEQNLGNIPNNPGVMGILYSYDNGRHLNINDIDANYINPFINRVSQAAYGSQLIY